MSHKYHFCFCFNQIVYQGQDSDLMDSSTRFKLQFYQNNELISRVNQNIRLQDSRFTFSNQKRMISLVLEANSGEVHSYGEIRLIVRKQKEYEILIGCYNFPISNYATVYSRLGKNSVKVGINLTKHYLLQYEVIIQKSQEAFRLLKVQHLTAPQQNRISEPLSCQGEDDILEEFSKTNLAKKSEDLMPNNSWSSLKLKGTKSHIQQPSELSSNKIQKAESVIDSEQLIFLLPGQVTLRKMRSSGWQNQSEQTIQDPQNFQQDLEVYSKSIDEIMSEENIEQVIRKNSFVVIPIDGDDYWVYKQMKEKQLQGMGQNGLMEKNKVVKRRRRQSLLFTKILIALALLLLFGVGLGLTLQTIRIRKMGV